MDHKNPPADQTRLPLEKIKTKIEQLKCGKLKRAGLAGVGNNHIHTSYSFSPYSPADAVWAAYMAGLETCGLMDHDTLAGAGEFIQAGKLVGMATTVGLECRADMSQTPFADKRLNNPDQKANIYMAIHGIPHTKIREAGLFFRPSIQERVIRNKDMVENLNAIINPCGLSINFEEDVTPLSRFHQGGTVTERHICSAMAKKMLHTFGRGQRLLSFLQQELKIELNQKSIQQLTDDNSKNQIYEYDLLGALKYGLVGRFYIDAKAECFDVKRLVDFARRIGAIPAYAYLGDVMHSVTGDKKPQKFEDGFLDELFKELKQLGFQAVTYMPSRNSMRQLRRVQKLCEMHGFFQISGEDINSPRQSFVCEALKRPEFSHLMDATWALIGHELESTKDIGLGMFSKENENGYSLKERISKFKQIGQNYFTGLSRNSMT